MSRDYLIRFGSGNPTSYTGLTPTFAQFFVVSSGQTLTPPSISEAFTGSGIYKFSYEATQMIGFKADGATTGIDDSVRYVVGALDPADELSTRIGATYSSFGSTSADPGTALGYLKRMQEMMEGDFQYIKASGIAAYYNRGSSTLLRQKTIADSASLTTRT